MARKKRKLTKSQLRRSKRLAEKLKGKKRITNPFALARWMVKRKRRKKKRKR